MAHKWTEVPLDETAPADLGDHPWNTVPPFVLDTSAAERLGFVPAGSYAETVTADIDWLVRAARAGDPAGVLPPPDDPYFRSSSATTGKTLGWTRDPAPPAPGRLGTAEGGSGRTGSDQEGYAGDVDPSGWRSAGPGELAFDHCQVVLACLEAVVDFRGGHVEAERVVDGHDGRFL
jgi:hypothetical protein